MLNPNDTLEADVFEIFLFLRVIWLWGFRLSLQSRMSLPGEIWKSPSRGQPIVVESRESF